VLPSGFNSEVI
jgi:hypothetical protein